MIIHDVIVRSTVAYPMRSRVMSISRECGGVGVPDIGTRRHMRPLVGNPIISDCDKLDGQQMEHKNQAVLTIRGEMGVEFIRRGAMCDPHVGLHTSITITRSAGFP